MSPTIVLIIASCMWGLTWWPLKELHGRGVEGMPLIVVAYGTVALLTLPVLWRERADGLTHKRMMGAIFVLGGVANLSFASALVYGDVVRVMVLFYLLPLWGVLGGRIFLAERIDARRGLGMILALIGAFCVLGGTALFERPPSAIDGVAVLAGFAFAMNNICFRASQDLPVPSKVSSMFLGCAFAAALLIAFGLQGMPQHVSVESWALVVGFGVYLLVATAGTQWGVTHMEAGRSSIIMILELLGAAVSAALITRRVPLPLETLGGTLIVVATLVEARAASLSPR